MATGLGGREGVPRLERPGATQELRPRDASVSVGNPPRGAHARLHDRGRRHALPLAKRHARAAPAGIRLLRAAGRERRDPRRRPSSREHRTEHRAHHALDAAGRLGLRLGPLALDPRRRVLPLAAVAVPAVLRARARVPEGRARQVVSERPDRDRERAGARGRHVRALRRGGRVARHGAVVLPDHRLRAGAPRRPRDRGLAGVDQGAPTELDRPFRRL